MHVSIENNNIDWMWLWWGGTVALCLWKLIEAVVFRPMRLLEWPFVACTMWLYFFGYMAYKAKMTLSAYLGNNISEIGQLMDFLCLVGILAGWAVGTRVSVRATRTTPQNYPFLLCWLAGLVLVLLGAVGSYSVSRASDEGDLNFHTASAYWYLFYYVGYPGLAIALWAALKSKSPVKWVLLGLTLAGMVVFLAPYLANARRGPLYPAIIILLLVPPLTMRRPPNRLFYCGGLAAVAMTMLLFLQIRVTIYNGGTWSEAFQKLDVSDAVVDRGDDAFDNEYVNNCQLIGTVFQNGKYEYGTGHLELLVHWIPRALWPAKPELGAGYYSNNELFDDLERATGVRLLGYGASSAGVADSFLQYGVLCPLFWFVISFAMGVVYLKAIRSATPWWMFCYVSFLSSSHWLISQSFTAEFVPLMYFLVVPVALLLFLKLHARFTRPVPRMGPRPTSHLISQPTAT